MAQNGSGFSKDNTHIFYIIVKNKEERTKLIKHLEKKGINAIFHYVPLHSSPLGRKFCRTVGDLPNTTNLSERVLRLPLYYEMTEEQVYTVATEIKNFYQT
jgi:dTDP-4-amino-4,6-dideoxygalactose transaminase